MAVGLGKSDEREQYRLHVLAVQENGQDYIRLHYSPENWDEVVNFAESPRGSYEEIRKARPDMDSARTALNGYLEAIKLENCEIQDSYINSLGLR